MSFTINIDKTLTFPSIKLIDNTHNCTAQVFSFGCILNSFSISKNNKTFNVIDGYKNIDEAIYQKNTWFKSCKLSPFVCRLKDGKYSWNDEQFTIEKFYLGKHAIHGLIYDAVFDIDETIEHEDFASVSLSHKYLGSDKGFRYAYTTKVNYTLTKNNELTITTKVFHDNATKIPFADGWHLYFKMDKPIAACSLQFSSINKMEFDNEMIPTGVMIEENVFGQGKLLKDLSLDDCFELEKNATIQLKGKDILLKISPTKNYPFTQIFTPDHQENIAIEPLSSVPDSFNNKIGLMQLEPNTLYEYEIKYCIESLN